MPGKGRKRRPLTTLKIVVVAPIPIVNVITAMAVKAGRFKRLLIPKRRSFMMPSIILPVFGLLIALIGCFEGLKVEGSAESVGQRTTQSVVEGIFIVIVADAFFSIMFEIIGV